MKTKKSSQKINIAAITLLGLISLPTLLIAESKSDFRNKLYQCMIERQPYEYMFIHKNNPDAATIQLFGKTFSSYVAGTRGAMHYSNFNECMYAMQFPASNARKTMWGSLKALETYTGIQILFRTKIFKRINPAILQWGLDHLLPPAEEKLDGHTYQEIYNIVLKRSSRLMTVTYLHLKYKVNYKDEQLVYIHAYLNSNHFNPIMFLSNRYGHLYQEYDTGINQDYGILNAPGAIGFWLRRGLNNTDTNLWQILRIAMLRYDSDWFKDIEARYK